MSKLRISPAARMNSTESGILITSGLGTFQLHGADVRVFAGVLEPLLDGSRDAAEIAAAVGGYSRSSVISFLELLRQRGLIEEVAAASGERGWSPASAAERSRPQERFFQAFGADPAAAAGRLRNARLLVAGGTAWGAAAAGELAAAGAGAIHLLDGEAGISAAYVTGEDLLALRILGPADLGRPRREALRAAIERQGDGCAVTTGPLAFDRQGSLETAAGPFSLLLAALPGDDSFTLQRLARYAQQAGLPSLHGHLEGNEIFLGPAVLPGQTGCWNCLRLRRLAVAASHAGAGQAAHDLDAARLAAPPPPRAPAWLAPMAAQAGLALAMEALKLLAGHVPSQLLGRFQVLDLATLASTRHLVVPMPFCEVCGGAATLLERNPGLASPAPPRLDQLPDVAALRQALAGWVDERVGVIHTLTGTSPDLGLPLPLTASAYQSAYSEGRFDPAAAGMIGSGKGATALAAHVGAAGEAIERYSAARYRLAGLEHASYQELPGEKIDPRRLALYDDGQYARPGFPFARYSPKKPIHWLAGKWLGAGEAAPKVWVPALVAYFNFQPPSPAEYFCQVSSNGLAAGSSVEDAGLRAAFELIERDAAMLTWLARLPAPRIELDASLDAASWQVVAQLAARGVSLELYLFDVGTGIPTAFCLGFGDGRGWPGTTVSLATHTDPRQAAAKAILEQAHVGPYLASLLPNTRVPGGLAEVHTLEDHASYYFPPERQAAFSFLRGGSAAKSVKLAEIPDAGPPTAENCAARLAAAGLRVAVADVTSPDVALGPFRVARAVGPEMLPIHFGSAFRRLGSARLKKLLGKKAINPHPHPIA